jgi:hypothetical protein
LSKIEYSPQSEAALTNFKALLLLEIVLLSGNDYDWSSLAVKGGGAAGAVLPAGSAHDDADESGAKAVASPEGEAKAAADAASCGRGRRTCGDRCGRGVPLLEEAF